MDEWKNGELCRLLYEEALRPNPLFEMFPLPRSTRRQRLRWRIEEIARRIRRASDVLLGREDD